MRSVIAILSMAAAIAAEAPYHLPHPAINAPAFPYPAAPAPPPPPPPPPPPSFHPQPAPQPIPNFGYHYQQPNIAPTFVQPAPQHQYPQSPPIHTHYQPQPPPQPYPHPNPQPQPVYYQPAPQPVPVNYLQPQPPSPHYGLPQIAPQLVHPHPHAPVNTLPAYVAPHPQPQPLPQQPSFGYQPIPHQQPRQGYSYQQPQAQLLSQPQLASQIPLQAQPLSSGPAASGLSSYQADSNQYNSAQEQTHKEALDSVVVNRVQNIIKDDEHSSARNAGFLSLVSGVSLGNAKPSLEISSFTHTSPLHSDSSSASLVQGSTSSATSFGSAQSSLTDYGLPSASYRQQSNGDSTSVSLGFLPQTRPAISYGTPN